MVWIDEWRLAVGDSLHTCIGKAINESAYVVVILSPDSVQSLWCRDELEQALTREKRTGQKVVLPLLYRRVIPPPFIEGRLYLNFSSSYWRSLALLAGFLHGLEQQLVSEVSSQRHARCLEDVRQVLTGCGLSPGIPLPEGDYRHLMRIFREAGVDIPRDRFRLILPEGIIEAVDSVAFGLHKEEDSQVESVFFWLYLLAAQGRGFPGIDLNRDTLLSQLLAAMA